MTGERTMRVTSSFFPLLDARPLLGRLFVEEEMESGNDQPYWVSA